MIKPMFVGITLDGMKEFEITSAPDWWPDAPLGKFSPQTLLLSASASCVILSLFKAAQAFHAEFKDVKVIADGPMVEDGPIWRFERVDLKMSKVTKAAEMAHKSCPIANSLNCPTNLDLEIMVG
jgi:uncharacterized OsmC-like protein